MTNNKEINVEELRGYINNIMNHIREDLGIKSLMLTESDNFFWEVPLDEMFKIDGEAPQLVIGSTADSLEFVQSAIQRGARQSDAAALMLMHVIPLLQVLCNRVRA